jgi:hypothetical protein
MTLAEPKYDIFSGQIDINAMWVESVEGLSNARDRMRQIAADKPGRYFIFSPASNSVLAEMETVSSKAAAASQANGSAA